MNLLYHHWYFVFIFVVASGQWLKCEAASAGKGQNKDVAGKVNKRDYSDYGLGSDYAPDYPSYYPADNPSDKSDFEISYNFAGNIKFKLGSKKNKKPQSFFPYWLLNFLPTTESGLVACPSYIPSPICARYGSCVSDSECNYQEVCCLTEEWIGYSCCVSTVEVTTVEDITVEDTSVSYPVPAATCPYYIPSPQCQRSGPCQSDNECFFQETCCQINDWVGYSCCVSTVEVTGDTTVSYPVTVPAASCPYNISSPQCQRSGPCQSDNECLFQETCCQINDWIGYSCCVSTAEVTTVPEPDFNNFCPSENPNLACRREGSCSSNADCSTNEICCEIESLLAVGKPSCCVLYSDLDTTSTEDITKTTTETGIFPDFTESIIPNLACPNRDDYNPDACYNCSPTMPRAVCYDTEACCFSSIKARYCCYNNGTATSPTLTTETPTSTTTETPVYSTVFIKTCVIPPGVSHYYWPKNCVSSSDCITGTECCNGFAGAGCYDWPTRVPEPGSSCPRGYKTCALQPGIEGEVGTPKTCSNDDYNTVCSESEYCCKINNNTNACCVEKNTELVWPER